MATDSDLIFQRDWNNLVKRLEAQFGQELDFDGIIFLIGIQELGKGHLKLNKTQKMDVMHLAVCKLLSQYNYYQFVGFDEEGWPHYEATELLPHLKAVQQHKLIKEAIISYFKNI